MDNNPSRLDNKTILITGGTSGIGEYTLLECWRRGAETFAIGGRDKPENVTAWERIYSQCTDKPTPTWFPRDVCPEQTWLEIVNIFRTRLETTGRGIDVLFLNAGSEGDHCTIEEITLEAMAKVAVNMLGVVWALKHMTPIVAAARGYIVLCSSEAAVIGRSKYLPYAGSKAATENFMRSTAKLWEDKPGYPGFILARPKWVSTPLSDRVLKQEPSYGLKERVRPEFVANSLAELFAGGRQNVHIKYKVLLKPKAPPQQ